MRKINTKQEFSRLYRGVISFIKHIILEDLLFPLILVIIFARVDLLMENAQNVPNYDWGNALGVDMEKHWALYAFVVVVWLIWVRVRASNENRNLKLYSKFHNDIDDIKQSLRDIVTLLKTRNDNNAPKQTTKND